MANRIRGKVYIVDSGGVSLEDIDLSVYSIAFYSSNTTGELQISYRSDTADVVVHIRNNQGQPFTLPLFLGGHEFSGQLHINRCIAGTGFLYLR